ncbi:MAG: DUF5107 domain-containing protein, partial [Anaerolineae bacterium]
MKQNVLPAGSAWLLAVLMLTACAQSVTASPTLTATISSTVAASALTPTRPANPTVLSIPTTATATPPPTVTPIPPTPLPPTPTSAPTVAATASGGAEVTAPEITISIPTYPIKDFLEEKIDPLYHIPVYYFNRPAYEASGPAPKPVDYTGVVLENEYLRLIFLPELGGRLYSAVVKATGQEIFYHNPVVKPSRYGVLQPYEANWWLATGGMEWAYPTQEHGYRFGIPWSYKVSTTGEGTTITLSDVAEGRVGAEVTVTLPFDSAAFIVEPRLVNGTSQPVPVQFWTNAALTLGAASMSPQTQFIVPSDKIIVHSRGEPGWTIPGERQESAWPLAGQTDLRQYSQWANYLGFFVPNMKAPFIGAYNPETDVGVARL